MDKRALKFGALQPGDRVSVPRAGKYGRPSPKGGREIAEFMFIDPDTMDWDLPEVIVKLSNGRLKRWPLWRVRLFVDEKLRREIRQLEADLEDERRDNDEAV